MKIDIGITDKDRSLSGTILNTLLANEFLLLAQTLGYHWNLVGPEFHDYHLLFDKQYKAIFEFTDDIAERTRSIGEIALGSLQQFIDHGEIKEGSEKIPAPKQMVRNLLESHEIIIKHLREGINQTAINNRDLGTSNFLTELIEKHEKMAWMLRSLLQ